MCKQVTSNTTYQKTILKIYNFRKYTFPVYANCKFEVLLTSAATGIHFAILEKNKQKHKTEQHFNSGS